MVTLSEKKKIFETHQKRQLSELLGKPCFDCKEGKYIKSKLSRRLVDCNKCSSGVSSGTFKEWERNRQEGTAHAIKQAKREIQILTTEKRVAIKDANANIAKQRELIKQIKARRKSFS